MGYKSDQADLGDVPLRKRGGKETVVLDPIHGFIDISEYPVIEQLVGTPYVQRLRRLSQLGLASYVYPGATHTRFSHCLGVMSVFLTLYDSVTRRSGLDPRRIAQMRPVGAVAALLHDLGHGPFSHASEGILEGGKFNHEQMTQKIILETEIAEILEKNGIDPRMICDIMSHSVSGDLKIISQLVSSQLDADRMDYLARDSFFTGVNYGITDIARIANTLRIWEEDGPYQWSTFVPRKGISAVENYIFGRRLMYDRVYFHKGARCAERILSNAFQRAEEIRDADLRRLVNTTKYLAPEQILGIDDHACFGLVYKWLGSDDIILRDLSEKIVGRELLASYSMSRSRYMKLDASSFGSLESLVRRSGYDPRYYLFYNKSVKSTYDVYSIEDIDDTNSVTNHILVLGDNRTPVEISSVSDPVRALSTDSDAKEVSIFFPKKISQEAVKLLGE